MIEITGNRMLTSWILISLMGGTGWLLMRTSGNNLSRMITAPKWVLFLCGVKGGSRIDHQKIGLQFTCLFWVAWSSIVTVFVSNQDVWYKVLRDGILLEAVVLLVFEFVKNRVLNKRPRSD